MQIYICRAGERTGPFSLEEVQARLEACAFSPADLAWFEGVKDWIPLAQVPGLRVAQRAVPPRLDGASTLPSAAPSPRPATNSPPRKGLLITGGVGAILLALVLLGTGVSLLTGPDKGAHWLGLLMVPASVAVGVISIQFFLALSRNPTGRCKVCAQFKPTLCGSLNRHVGAIILMFHAHITGHMCKDCIGHIFWRFTPLTLGAGWWGLFSFFITPLVLVNNVAFYVRSRFIK